MSRLDEAIADPDTLILGGGDGDRLRRAQRSFFQLAALVGCADSGTINGDDLAGLMMILHDEISSAIGGAIPPAGRRH
ncbi:MAG: hypothetical protein KGR68_09810 [Betaproteobacteria bacterium]|nr:hypothetical protein [Betaproteobacteria bacterium]